MLLIKRRWLRKLDVINPINFINLLFIYEVLSCTGGEIQTDVAFLIPTDYILEKMKHKELFYSLAFSQNSISVHLLL